MRKAKYYEFQDHCSPLAKRTGLFDTIAELPA
jgi:hypothetical protein